jgi:hypothetical protein
VNDRYSSSCIRFLADLLSVLANRPVPLLMATAVFLRLRDGRRVRFGRSRDPAGAAKVKTDVEQWISAGITLSVANSHGGIEDVAPATVEAVELVGEPTPTRGSAAFWR